jgi:transposase-like protein
MIFAHFIRVNHHLQSVFFGCAFLFNERIESYEWLFRIFLHAMGGKAPRLIIIDEATSIRSAIKTLFPDTVHRFCMWHIMEKVGDKNDPNFFTRLNACVLGSEKVDEFEMHWNAIISDFSLKKNGWMANRFHICKSWIPVYFMDVPLAGVLRTTSRYESSNSFFNRFIHHKLSFVEF